MHIDTAERWEAAEQSAQDMHMDGLVNKFKSAHRWDEDAPITEDMTQQVMAYAALGEIYPDAICTAEEVGQILWISHRGYELRVQRSGGAILPLDPGCGNIRAYYWRGYVEQMAAQVGAA